MCLVAVRAVVRVGAQVSESGKSGSDVNLGCEDCTEGRMRTCTTYLPHVEHLPTGRTCRGVVNDMHESMMKETDEGEQDAITY